MKYILVTGGVISGVGKGVIASSFGTILKCSGVRVTCIKIDPYINIDAGTFSPYEHGKYHCLVTSVQLCSLTVSSRTWILIAKYLSLIFLLFSFFFLVLQCA